MGVKDRFPQPVSWQKLAPNATNDLGNEVEFPLVLPRAETDSTRIVTEITKVVWDLNGIGAVFGSALDGFRASLTYRALIATENSHSIPTATVGHEAVLDAVSIHGNLTGTAATYQVYAGQIEHNIGSGGAGLIFPGNKLFINISTDVDVSAHTIGCAIYYRQHLVGLTEFMGILATRQQQ